MTTAVLRRRAARLLHGARLVRPRVSVVLDGRGADPALVDRTLDSVRAQPDARLEIVVLGPVGDARVARHLAEDWRVRRGRTESEAQHVPAARGRFVMRLEPGDELVENAVAVLLAEVESSGADVAVGRAGGPGPATPRDAPGLVWPTRWGRALVRRAAHESPEPGPAGFVALLLRARSLTGVGEQTLLPRRPVDARFGVVDDPTPELAGWLDASRQVESALVEGDNGRVLEAWWLGWLGGEADRFLDGAERLDDGQWVALRDRVAAVVGSLGDRVGEVPVEPRVKAWLAAQGRRVDLEAFVVARRFEQGQYPTETRDGRVFAVLPVDVPQHVLRLGDAETPPADEERGRHVQRRLQQEYAACRDPLDPQLAYFQSYDGRSATDSPVAIHAEIRRRRPDLRAVWAVRDDAAWIPDGGEPVLWGSPEWYDVLARATYLVTNIEMERWFRRRDGQQLVQTFHGYPSKTMGIGLWRSKGFTDSRIAQQLERTSRQWSLLVTPSPEMDRYYREQYAYDGRIVAAGYPRDDVLVGPEAGAVRDAVRRRLGVGAGQTAVLYAPTWRDDLATNYRAARAGDFFDIDAAAAGLGGDYVLLLRGHRFHPRHTSRTRSGAARLVDVTDHPEINDLILASDAAVLDYSSLRFDYALTGRPMVFLVPDVAEYTAHTRGFLFDFAPTAPGPWVDDTAGVVRALRDLSGLREEYAVPYAAFNERFNSQHDGHAAERVVDALLG